MSPCKLAGPESFDTHSSTSDCRGGPEITRRGSIRLDHVLLPAIAIGCNPELFEIGSILHFGTNDRMTASVIVT